MRASGQPTLPVVGLQQLNDFAESYSAANLDLEVANTRRSQLAQTRGRTFSAALARGGRRSPRHHRPAHEAHRAREEARAPFPSTYAEDGLVGKRTRPLIYPPPATAPCWHAWSRLSQKKFSQLGGCGRRDDAIRVRPSMATMATMATPRSRLSKKILAARWVWVVLTSGHSPWIFFPNFSFRGGHGGHGGHGQPSSGFSQN